MLAVCAGEATVAPQVEGGLRMRRARTQGEQQRNHREEARHEARQSKPWEREQDGTSLIRANRVDNGNARGKHEDPQDGAEQTHDERRLEPTQACRPAGRCGRLRPHVAPLCSNCADESDRVHGNVDRHLNPREGCAIGLDKGAGQQGARGEPRQAHHGREERECASDEHEGTSPHQHREPAVSSGELIRDGVEQQHQREEEGQCGADLHQIGPAMAARQPGRVEIVQQRHSTGVHLDGGKDCVARDLQATGEGRASEEDKPEERGVGVEGREVAVEAAGPENRAHQNLISSPRKDQGRECQAHAADAGSVDKLRRRRRCARRQVVRRAGGSGWRGRRGDGWRGRRRGRWAVGVDPAPRHATPRGVVVPRHAAILALHAAGRAVGWVADGLEANAGKVGPRLRVVCRVEVVAFAVGCV
mmetsp:Transcript_6191/g.17931  ORF Transcript_6191/g.17931 Transcript_6191/m.17931 type:complete len:418 (+) Transcript_6191:460-1713(+)